MQRIKLLFSIFLIYSSTIGAMELAVIPADLFLTGICSRINRPARDAIRCTCKKYYQCIDSQDTLNFNYAKFFALKDIPQMLRWKNLGGSAHQELAQAIKDKQYDLARWLLLTKKKVKVWDAYCRNIQDAVEEKKVEETVPVITWLLGTLKPLTYLNEFLDGYNCAKNLKEKNPEVQKIIDVFEGYRKAGTEAQERARIQDLYSRYDNARFGDY